MAKITRQEESGKVPLRHIGRVDMHLKNQVYYYDDGTITNHVTLVRYNEKTDNLRIFSLFPENLKDLRDFLNTLDLDHMPY